MMDRRDATIGKSKLLSLMSIPLRVCSIRRDVYICVRVEMYIFFPRDVAREGRALVSCHGPSGVDCFGSAVVSGARCGCC